MLLLHFDFYEKFNMLLLLLLLVLLVVMDVCCYDACEHAFADGLTFC